MEKINKLNNTQFENIVHQGRRHCNAYQRFSQITQNPNISDSLKARIEKGLEYLEKEMDDIMKAKGNVQTQEDLNSYKNAVYKNEDKGNIERMFNLIINEEPSLKKELQREQFLYNIDLMASRLNEQKNTQRKTQKELMDGQKEFRDFCDTILSNGRFTPADIDINPTVISLNDKSGNPTSVNSYTKKDISKFCDFLHKIHADADFNMGGNAYMSKFLKMDDFDKFLSEMRRDYSGKLAELQTEAGLENRKLSSQLKDQTKTI